LPRHTREHSELQQRRDAGRQPADGWRPAARISLNTRRIDRRISSRTRPGRQWGSTRQQRIGSHTRLGEQRAHISPYCLNRDWPRISDCTCICRQRGNNRPEFIGCWRHRRRLNITLGFGNLGLNAWRGFDGG
jgi:hypothetical protein